MVDIGFYFDQVGGWVWVWILRKRGLSMSWRFVASGHRLPFTRLLVFDTKPDGLVPKLRSGGYAGVAFSNCGSFSRPPYMRTAKVG